MSDTIAAIATGASVSAIGIVRVSGEQAINAVSALFSPAAGRPMSAREDRKLVYGTLHSRTGEMLDMCMCTVSRAPNSYTGENTAELQCHGSPVVLREVMKELAGLGVRQAKPGEFTKRAFLNGRMELTSAEAVADLIDAETAEAARNAAGQLSGAIRRKTDRIYSALTDICSHYHAVLDYPDEDIEDFRMEAYRRDISSAKNELEGLLNTFERGSIINSGIPAVIVGRPNAGKSSLLNSLLGYDRAIVTAVPGTTRDTIEEKLRIGNVLLRLTDTAGIRAAADEAERLGVERTFGAVKNAKLVVAVIDGSDSAEEDRDIVSAAEKAPKGIVVVTRKDIAGFAPRIPDTKLPTVEISTVTGEGIDRLESIICSMFPLPDVPAGEIITNSRQAEAISSAVDYLKAAYEAMENGETPDIVLTEVEGAMSAIGELSGRALREDITERIFERFCVGK